MKTTPIREEIYEFIEIYVDTPEPKKLCSSIEDLVEELAESKVKNLALTNVMQWVAVKDELPPILQTIWLSNGKGWTDLGCRLETNDGWHWAGQNGIIYQEKNQIVAECESDDLDVIYWHKLPEPPCA